MRKKAGPAGSSLCNEVGCPICALHDPLVTAGARPHRGSAFRESGCSFDVRFGSDHGCRFRLRLDVQDADYRRLPDAARTSKMCDFAAAARRGREIRLLVVEIKKGPADRNVVDQLQAGLDLLHNHLPQGTKPALPDAYLVAGSQTAQLKHILRSRPRPLRFDHFRVAPRVHRCGDGIEF